MPRDVQIVRSAAESAPKDYTIPKDAEVILRAVKATFTDNGAGTDWLPCVTLISDSGHKIAQALDPNVKVTAGDDAEVSWFPGVKPGRAAGGGTFQWCRVVCGTAIPSGPISSPNSGTAMPIAAFDTSDPANYVQVDGFTWNIPAVPQIACGYMQVNGGPLTTLNGDVYCVAQKSGGGLVGAYGQNTLKLLIEWFSYTLTRASEVGGTWEAFAAGADTHSFVLVITYGAVY